MDESTDRNRETVSPANDRQGRGVASLGTASTPGFAMRLGAVVLVVGAATVFVVALRIWCVTFAGLLLGVFLYRLSGFIAAGLSVPYRVALGGVIAMFLAGFGLLIQLIGPTLGEQLGNLSSKLTAVANDLASEAQFSRWVESLSEEAPQFGNQLLGNLDAAAVLGGAFSSVASAGATVFLVVFIGFFLAWDPDLYRGGLLQLVPESRRRRAAGILDASLDTLWWWTVGRLIAMTIVGVATAIGLWILGMPMPFLLGTIAGLISFVPTIGAVLAILPALLLAAQEGWAMVLYVLALYLAVQAVENNLITPLVQQRAVSVPPVILIVSQVLMGVLVGIMGVAIATPLAALVIALVKLLYVDRQAVDRTATASNT